MKLLLWRLGAVSEMMAHGWGLGEAWRYAVALSEGDGVNFFAEGYSPRDAILEDHSYGA